MLFRLRTSIMASAMSSPACWARMFGLRVETERLDVSREVGLAESGDRRARRAARRSLTLAREAARNYRALRSRGHTVRKTFDYLIATFCLREQHSLLHRDRDFDPLEKVLELSVIHPS